VPRRFSAVDHLLGKEPTISTRLGGANFFFAVIFLFVFALEGRTTKVNKREARGSTFESTYYLPKVSFLFLSYSLI